MSRLGVSFHGADIILPGVYTYTDLSQMLAVRGVPSRAIAIVAEGKGGAVGALTRVTTSRQISRALVGGDAANMARIAMGAGADDIYVARVNAAVAATLDLGDLLLTHRNPGATGNRTQVLRATNPDRADATDITIRDTAIDVIETYTRMGPLIDVTYEGTDNPSIDVSTDGNGVVTITLDSDAVGGGETVTLTSDSVPDVRNAAALINDSGAWSATVVGDPNASLELLDGTTPSFTGSDTVLNAGSAAEALALEGSDLVEATVQAGASTSTGAYQFMTGGTEGPATTAQDYIDALALLEGVEVIAVVLGSSDGAAIAGGRSHVYQMSDVKARRERILYVGGGTQTLKADVKTEVEGFATSYGGDRVVIAGNTVKDYDLQTGKLTDYPGYYLAAYAAGYKAARRPEVSLTNKPITLPGLGHVFTDDELEQMSDKGVMIANFDGAAGRNTIRDGVTSYTQDANITRRSIAGMDSLDWLNKRIRISMQGFIGRVADRTLIQSIRLATEKILRSETRGTTGVLTPGTDPDTGEQVPSFENLEVVFDGTNITGVTFECHPVGENKYMFVESTFTPVQVTA